MRYIYFIIFTLLFAGCVTLDKAKAKLEKNPGEAAKWAQKMFPVVPSAPTFDSSAYISSLKALTEKYDGLTKIQDSLAKESDSLRTVVKYMSMSDTGQCTPYIAYIYDLETMLELSKKNLQKAVRDCETSVKPIIKEVKVPDTYQITILQSQLDQKSQLLKESEVKASKLEGMYSEVLKREKALKKRLNTIYFTISGILIAILIIVFFKFRSSIVTSAVKILRFGK